jgi:hypothetical protein
VKTLSGVMESRSLDFKAERIGGSDGDKREFVADVCAFANASGGAIGFRRTGPGEYRGRLRVGR